MFSPEALGKLLLFAGAFIVVLGLLFVFWNKIPLVGRLPPAISSGERGLSHLLPCSDQSGGERRAHYCHQPHTAIPGQVRMRRCKAVSGMARCALYSA
jgi:hypothetical protein